MFISFSKVFLPVPLPPCVPTCSCVHGEGYFVDWFLITVVELRSVDASKTTVFLFQHLSGVEFSVNLIAPFHESPSFVQRFAIYKGLPQMFSCFGLHTTTGG